MRHPIWKSRPLKALLIAVALMCAVPASGFAEKAVVSAAGTSAADGIQAAALIGARDPQSALSKIEELGASSCEVPDYFQSEIGVIPGARDMRVNVDGTVVGYVCDEAPAEALDNVRSLMTASGWSEIPLGEEEGATFVKEGGACNWTLVTCSQVGEATGVVFRSALA